MKRLAAVVATAATLLGLIAGATPAVAVDTCHAVSTDEDWSKAQGPECRPGTPWVDREVADRHSQQTGPLLPASEWYVAPLSYESSNVDWPRAQSKAVACLQQTISFFAGATEKNTPSVYLVGHSMGGILARFALDQGDQVDFGPLVGGLVTLDTPHRGSPWGGSNYANLMQWWSAVKGGASVTEGATSAAKCRRRVNPGHFRRSKSERLRAV